MSAAVDLHLHTTASDGRLTPAELVRLVAQTDIQVFAITDHDSMEGLAAAQEEVSAHPALTLIPGVELGTEVAGGEVHMLGYFLDTGDEELQRTLALFRQGRDGRARRMVEKLEALGVPIEWSRVEELAQGGAIARPHVALALVERGHVASFQEAFDTYIGNDGPAHVAREKMAPEEAVGLILAHGGVPVLAHPARYMLNLEEQLPALKSAGLVGMEAFYKDYTAEEVKNLLALCREYDLVPCGGSDFHALKTPDEMAPGTVGPPLESVQRLAAQVGPRGVAMAPD